jgi:hypothetical protein
MRDTCDLCERPIRWWQLRVVKRAFDGGVKYVEHSKCHDRELRQVER